MLYLFSYRDRTCPKDVKEAAYKGIVRPVLEYGTSVWDPHTKEFQDELKKVQKRATRSLYGRLRECHNKITQPIPSTQRKRKPLRTETT